MSHSCCCGDIESSLDMSYESLNKSFISEISRWCLETTEKFVYSTHAQRDIQLKDTINAKKY
jgi:hypothetical protein